MPLMGLLVTLAVFASIAVALLAIVPGFRIRFWSIAVFMLCEYAGAAAFSVIYARLVATPSGALTSTSAVLGYFAGALASAIILGILVVWLLTRLIRKTQPDAPHKA